MSFMLTTQQVRDGAKDITRRRGWWFLKPGDRVMACVKCQGIKKGTLERIREIEVVSVGAESLSAIVDFPQRGGMRTECDREGFPDISPLQFVQMFCRNIGVGQLDTVNRIEFRYV